MATNGPGSIDLARLTDELDGLFEGSSVYVNRRSGEIVSVMDSDLVAIEDGEGEEELQDGDETRATLQAIVESNDWVAMPDKFEIDEWQIMSDFALSLGGNRGAELAQAIRGRGAFGRFEDAIYRGGIQDRWFDFKRAAIEQIAVRALEAEGIPYHRGQKRIVPR